MSEYVAYNRFKAYRCRTAVSLGCTRNFPVSDLPLILIPIQMAGEAPALFALGVGNLAGNLDVLSCPNPPDRDCQYSLLAQAANAIKVVIDQWQADQLLIPQMICQSDAAATLMLAVFDRMAYINPDYSPPPIIKDIGQIMVFFNRRFERADSSAVLSAPRTVCTLYATGQDPHADTHLGAVVEWLQPDDGKIIARVKAAENLPASASTDPDIDNKVLVPLVRDFYQANRNGDITSADQAQQKIHDIMEAEVQRRYELILKAMFAVIKVPESTHAMSVASADREQFKRHVNYVSSRHPPRGFSGSNGMVEFVHREVSHREAEVQCIQALGRQRAEARLTGEILHGTIVNRRNTKRGRATIIEYDVFTHQDRLRIRTGTALTLMGTDTKFDFNVLGLKRQAAGSLITLIMTVGMRKDGQPVVGQSVEFGPKFYFSRRTKFARDRINSAGVHPTVSGSGVRGTDYLAIIRKLEANQ